MKSESEKANKLANSTYLERVKLASVLRKEIKDAVYQYGGHLASNLGIVDLTIALLSHFDPFKNDIFFDVGHQMYAYKILTGRHLTQLRQLKGLSPFSSREESLADKYDSGHSGSALSTAIGYALADSSLKRRVVIIGDSSLENGGSFEALVNLSKLDLKNILVVVNVNAMSISPNTSKRFNYLKDLESKLNAKTANLDYGDEKAIGLHRKDLKKTSEKLNQDKIVNSNIYKALGLEYLGVVNGHDPVALDEKLNEANAQIEDKPCVLEVLTIKGYDEGEQKDYPHSCLPKFAKPYKDGDLTTSKAQLIKGILREDKDAFLLTPSMQYPSALTDILNEFPKRAVDCSIAEGSCFSIASGLALSGKHVIVDIHSAFFARGVDQLLSEVCKQSLPILFLVERVGLVGGDGYTHHGLYDISFSSSLPTNSDCCDIYLPYDYHSLSFAIKGYKFTGDKPRFVRIPREDFCLKRDDDLSDLIYLTRKNKDAIALSTGPRGLSFLSKVDKLSKALIFNENAQFASLLSYKKIFLYDAYSTINGLAKNLQAYLSKSGYTGVCRVKTFPANFFTYGKQDDLYKYYEMDEDSALLWLEDELNAHSIAH